MSSSALESFFEGASDFLNRVLDTAGRQFQRSYNELNKRMLLRVAMIIGGYLIFRPLIVMFFDRTHKASQAKEERAKQKKKKQSLERDVGSKTNPNTLRYGPLSKEVEVSDDTDSEAEAATATAMTDEDRMDRQARRRHRRHVRAQLDEDELHKFAEDEWEDPDLTDLFPPSQRR